MACCLLAVFSKLYLKAASTDRREPARKLGLMPALPPVITSRTNARVKELRASLSGAARKPGDLLGLEGEHLLREAHLHRLRLETVYLRAGSQDLLEMNPWIMEIGEDRLCVLSQDVFDSAVSTASPQGVAATWVIQDPVSQSAPPGSALILEDLRDPGNLGTLIRSAAAFGFGRVFITIATVNQWNPKVVRSAMGAIFQTRVHRLPLDAIIAMLRGEGLRIFAGVSSFLTGPEHGFPEQAAPHGVLTGRVPNSAASEGARYSGTPAEEEAGPGYAASLAYDADVVQPCGILVGKEGAGLSGEALALSDEQVLIPCGFESLNAAVAGSILMYEVIRQVPLRVWARREGLRP